MSNLLASFADIDNNGRYIQDYFEFTEIPSEFKKSHDSLPNMDNITIQFDHVSFKYPNQTEYALKDINLTITDKTCLSLVGENGSGKTTFVKLLIRLCDPTEGNIYLNGITPEVKFIEVLSSADESLKSMFRNRMHCEIPTILNSDDYQNCNSENCRRLAKDRFNVFIEKCVAASGDNEIIIKNELINMIVDTIPNGEVQRLLGPIYNSH